MTEHRCCRFPSDRFQTKRVPAEKQTGFRTTPVECGGGGGEGPSGLRGGLKTRLQGKRPGRFPACTSSLHTRPSTSTNSSSLHKCTCMNLHYIHSCGESARWLSGPERARRPAGEKFSVIPRLHREESAGSVFGTLSPDVPKTLLFKPKQPFEFQCHHTRFTPFIPPVDERSLHRSTNHREDQLALKMRRWRCGFSVC